jgi:hypothetical protein
MLKRNEVLFLMGVLVLAIFLRSLFLTDQYLVDEVDRVNWANEPGFEERLIEKTPTYSPLIYLLLGSVHARVNNLYWERLLPLVIGCIVILLGYFWAKPFGLEKEMAILLAVLPHQVVYSIQLSAYIYLILLGILYTHFLFFSQHSVRLRFVIAGLIAGLGHLFHYGFLALVAATVIYLSYHRKWKEWAYYLVGFAPLFLINLPFFIQQRQFSRFHDLFALDVKSTLVTLADFPHFTYSPILILITLAGIYLFLWKRKTISPPLQAMLWHSILFMAIIFAGTLSTIVGFIPRYLIVAQPALMLGLFALLKHNLTPKKYNVVVGIYALVLILTTIYIATQFPILNRIPLYY